MQIEPNPNRRILVVDDNQAIHDDFRKIFRANGGDAAITAVESALFGDTPGVSKNSGRVIDFAYQGQEGLAMVERAVAEGRPYPMAFIDVRMPPGWDGIETIARMWEKYPDLQVVVCTAYSDYSWDDMHRKLGESDRLVILKKPFDNIEVLQLAAALTEKWWLHQQSRRKTGELESLVAERTAALANTNEALQAEITERKRTEEQLRVQATALDAAANAIVITDHTGTIQWVNRAFTALTGYTGLEAVGQNPRVLKAGNHGEAFYRNLWQTISNGQVWSGELTNRRKDGSLYEEAMTITPLRNADGVIARYIAIKQNITERKMFEVQLRQAQKLESIGHLAAGIAHEINTPTQFIGDNTRFLRDAFVDLQPLFAAQEKLLAAARHQAVTPGLIAEVDAARAKADLDYLLAEVPKAISQTIEGIERMTKIVHAMKEFSHPGGEGKAMLDLNQAIESTLVVCRSEWKYVAELVTDFDPQLPLVPVLPGEFNQVILNLVINATHAITDAVGDGSRGKGRLTLSTRSDGDWIEVRVRDTGTGIPEKARGRIFDPFFTTKGVGKGTGQGLAIARSVVVDKHGGTISFETETGKGTCFIIRLPAAAPTGDQPRKAV